jgi:hypothetical protein
MILTTLIILALTFNARLLAIQAAAIFAHPISFHICISAFVLFGGPVMAQADDGVIKHPMMPYQLKVGLEITEVLEILRGEDWQPESRVLSRVVPVQDKQISLWFGDRKIVFTSCLEISGDVSVANGRTGLAHCQLNFSRGDRRLQLTTLHRFSGEASNETPVLTTAKIEPYNTFLLNNPPGSHVVQALQYLEAEGWIADPHIYDGLLVDDPAFEPMKEWYNNHRISNIECWNESYSVFEPTDDIKSIDAYGLTKLPTHDVPTCSLSFVKNGKRIVLKAATGKLPGNAANWPGPLVLDWSEPEDLPEELMAIQPGLKLSKVLRLLHNRFANGRHWVASGTRQEFLARIPTPARSSYREYTKRSLYNAECNDVLICKLDFINAKELGKFSHLEIIFQNQTEPDQEPTVVRAAIWSGGGT